MFRSQMSPSPNGGDDIRSATAIMRQRLGKRPGANMGWLQRQGAGGGPQGIDPSQVTTQGGQQGIVGRGGNFQPLGAAAQGRLAAQQPTTAIAKPDPGSVTPEMIGKMRDGGAVVPQIGGGLTTSMASGPNADPAATMAYWTADRMAGAGPAPGVAGTVADTMPGQGPGGIGGPGSPGAGGAMPQFADKVGREAMPYGGGGVSMPGADAAATGMAGAVGTALAGAQGGGGAGAPGMPPAILQRLQALRAGGQGNPYRSLVSGALGAQGMRGL